MTLRTPARVVGAAIVLAFLLCGQASFAGIWLASLDGTCVDEHGKPLAGTVIHFTDPKNGKSFEVRTDSAGKFFYIAAQPSIYTVEIKRGRKPPVIFDDIDIQWSSQPLQLEINLERNTVTVTRKTMLPEFFRQNESQSALLAQGSGDQATVAAINQHLAAAKQLSDQGDWQGAIAELWNAIEIDSNRDLPWALLGAAYYGAATHSADGGKAQLEQCVTSYQKAIAIAPAAAYYNNLGNAYVSSSNTRMRWNSIIRRNCRIPTSRRCTSRTLEWRWLRRRKRVRMMPRWNSCGRRWRH
jgi:hypothetical protein